MSVNIGTIEGLLRWKVDGSELDKSLDDVAKRANVSRAQLNQYNKEIDSINSTYRKVAASIDPVINAEQKLEKAQSALSKALKLGLIDQGKHNDLLDKAREKYTSAQTPLEALVTKVVKLTGALGPVGGAGKEAAEGLEGLIGKAGGIGELVASLGPLLPLVGALAIALVGVGVAFEAFKFVGEAVSDGLELQSAIEKLNNTLQNTGSYSGLTGHQLTDLADKYEILTGKTDNEIIAAETVLARFKTLNSDTYPKALEVALAYAKAMGITADAAATKLGPALDGNSKSVAGLKDAGIILTKGQKETLTQLVETGNMVKYHALLFDILHEKVGKVSDQFDGNLRRQAARVGVVFDDLKEGIASELIPALEDLTVDIVNQLGGWEHLKSLMSNAGHWLGDRLRAAVYVAIIGFHEMAAAWDQVAIAIDRGILFILSNVKKFADIMSVIPGPLGAVWSAASSLIADSMFTVTKSLFEDTTALIKNQNASREAVKNLFTHRQALEGSNETYKKHKSAQDEVETTNKKAAAAQEKLNKLLLEGKDAVRDYDNVLGDLIKKINEQVIAQNSLLVAAGKGVFQYAQAKQEQERNNAIETATTNLLKAHRTEIEKLLDVESKLRASHHDSEADKVAATIKKATEDYDKQSKAVATLTGRNFDLKVSTDQTLKSTQSNYEFTTKVLTLQAQLTDAIDGTTFASREMSIHLETEKRQLDELKTTEGDLADSIAATVRREHERLDVMQDVIDVARQLNSLDNQASLQTAISQIDSSSSRYIQDIEQKYLEVVASIGKGSIVEGQKIITAVQKALDTLGFHIGNISDKIKADLQKIQDAQILATVQGASKTPYDLYKEERDKIVALMSSSTAKTKSQAADLAAYLEKLDSDFFVTRLSTWSSALSNLGNLFGGFLNKILQQISKAVSNVQAAYQTGQQIGGALNSAGIGGASLGSSLGGILAVVQIFYEVYNAVSNNIKKQRAAIMGEVTSLQVINGQFSSPQYFNQAGRQFDRALRNLLDQILSSITGTLNDLPEILIKARHDNKKFAAYVGGVFLGLFSDAQTAMEEAVAFAISNAKFTGLGPELMRALEASVGKTLDETEQNIATATNVRNARIGDAGGAYVAASDKYRQEIAAADRLGLSLTDLIAKRNRELEAIKNSALGIDTAASDRLRDLRSLSLGIAEVADSTTAQLHQLIDSTVNEIHRIEHEVATEAAGGAGGHKPVGGGAAGTGVTSNRWNPYGGFRTKLGEVLDETTDATSAELDRLRRALAEYTDELGKVPQALTDQEINMGVFDTLYTYLRDSPKYAAEAAKWARVKVEIEFAQIKLQLNLLNKWEEFSGMFNDAYNAALEAAGHTGRGHGGGNSEKQSVQSFIDDRRFQLQLAGMDQFHQQLAQINKDYEEQIKAAGKDAKLRAQLLALQRQETDAANRQHQKDVVAQFQSLVGPSDVFADIHTKFDTVRKGIEGAGFGAERASKMIDRLTAAEDAAVKKLSTQQFAGLLGDLSTIIVDSDTNVKQHLLHNELLRTQEIVNYQIKMIQMQEEYVILKAKGKLTADEIAILDKAFGWINANANILPGGKDWVFDTGQAAETLIDAGNTQLDAANSLRSAVDSLMDYQTSLHTDSSLGLVDPRTALDNSRRDYETNQALALTGNVDAISKFKDFAERYRTNLVAFSPSSELTANVLQGIDATINRIKALPSVQAALTPDATAIVTHLGYVASGVASLAPLTQAVNDNIAKTNDRLTEQPTAIAQASTLSQAEYQNATLAAQKSTTDKLQSLREDIQLVAGNVLAWRSEARTRDSDEKIIQSAQLDELKIIAKKGKKPVAGVGG